MYYGNDKIIHTWHFFTVFKLLVLTKLNYLMKISQ